MYSQAELPVTAQNLGFCVRLNPTGGVLTLNTEHLAKLESGTAHLAQRSDDALRVGLRQEGAGVQDGLFLA